MLKWWVGILSFEFLAGLMLDGWRAGVRFSFLTIAMFNVVKIIEIVVRNVLDEKRK